MANITGWGRGEWGEGAWNEAVPVRAGHSLNGWGELTWGETAWGGEKSEIDALQGQVGIAVVRENVAASVTGLEATTAIGSVTVTGDSVIIPDGLGIARAESRQPIRSQKR